MGFPGGTAFGEFFVGDVEVEFAGGDVDFDEVAFVDEGDGAAGGGFGGDVADAAAFGGAGEAAVGDEGDGFAEAAAGDGAGGGEHFLHAGTAARAFVADDDDITGFDFTIHDAIEGGFLRFEYDGGAFELHHVGGDAGGFDDGAVGGEVAEEDGEATLLGVGVFDFADDIVIFDFSGGDIFAEGFSRNGHLVKIESAGLFGDGFEDGGDAPGAVDVFHVVFAGGSNFADVGDALGDFVEVLDGEGDAGFDGDGEGVEDGVGGAAHGHVEGDGVFEGFLGEDVGGADIFVDEVDDGAAGGFKEAVAGGINGEDGAVAGEGQAEGFAEAVHGVGGEHAGAGAAGGAGGFFNGGELAEGDFSGGVGADGFEDCGEVGGLSGDGIFTRGHGTTGDEDGGDVDARGGHHHAGDDFVAVGDADDAVEAVGAEHGFDAVGDEFAAGEGVFHAGVAHGDAVIDADGVEFEGDSAGGADGVADFFADDVEMGVAGDDLDEGVADGDEGLVPVGIVLDDAGGAEEGAVGGFGSAFFDGIGKHVAAFAMKRGDDVSTKSRRD